jgi:outer membrane protein assembly factor BamB
VSLTASGDGGPGLAVALTGPTPTPVCGPEDPGGPSGQDVILLDAATGDVRWTAAAPSFVHELLVTEPDGDLVVASRSASASAVRGVSAASGATLWTAPLPSGARVWDVAEAGTAVAAAVSVPPAIPAAEDVARLVLLDPETGAVQHDVELDGGVVPAAASDEAATTLMRLAVAGLDLASPQEVVIRTDRVLAAVGLDGQIRWQAEPLGGRNVLTVSGDGGTDRVWVQGPYGDPVVEDPDYVLDGIERGRYRLHSVHPLTGALDRTIPLMAAVLGLARVDVNDDDVPDRVMGGLSQAMFALDGGSQRVLWTRPLEQAVLDVYPEDVDRDGSPDVIVEAHLEVHALDAATGAILWSYRHQPSLGAGRWSGFELADMNADGVRDVVLGTSSGAEGGLNAVESAHVLVLNGATGAVLWQRLFPPPLKRVNGLDVGDATGDGVPDVGVTFEALGAPWLYSVWMLDGANGVPLWQVDERNHPGGRSATMNAARMTDADLDGDADLAVLTVGDAEMDPAVRMHDGRTGAQLWLRETGTPQGTVDISGFGLHLGRIAPGQPPVLLATAKEDVDGSVMSYVHGLSPSGQTVLFQHVPNPLVWELEVGDVTGDGVGDVVVPWIRGFGIIDGSRALAGEPAVLGHLEERFPSKAKVFDVDGDGVLEVESFVTPGTWPLGLGQNQLIDVTVPSKAVGVIDLSP